MSVVDTEFIIPKLRCCCHIRRCLDTFNFYWLIRNDRRVSSASGGVQAISTEYNDFGEAEIVQQDVVNAAAETVTAITTNVYDDLGRAMSVTKTKEISSVEVHNVVTEKSYDAFGRETRVVQAKESGTPDTAMAVTDFAYDEDGNKVLEIRYLGTGTEAPKVNLANDLLTASEIEEAISDPSSGYAPNPDKFTAADQFVTKFDYDELGRVVQKTVGWELEGSGIAGDAQVFETVYTDSGTISGQGCTLTVRKEESTDPWGQSVVTAFDQLGRKVQVADEAGNLTNWTYDSRGNVIKVDLPVDDDIEYVYDALNRKIIQRQGGDLLGEYSYDPDGRLFCQIDYRSASDSTRSVFKYDLAGRMTSRIDDAYGTDDATRRSKTRYEYGGFGNRLKIIDARHADEISESNRKPAAEFEYDELNRVTKKISAERADSSRDNTTINYDVYSNYDHYQETTLRDGTVVKRKFDQLDRLVQVEVGSQIEQTFTYDALSRMILAVDYNGDYANRTKAHAVDYTYDKFSRVTVEDQGSVDSSRDFVSGKQVQSAFDALAGSSLSWQKTVTYPSGWESATRHEVRGLPDQVGLQSGSTFTEYATYRYDAQGRASGTASGSEAVEFGQSTGDGMTLGLSHDGMGREDTRIYKDKQATPNSLFSVDTTIDFYGNITQEDVGYRIRTQATPTEQFTFVSNTKDYTHDALNRLTEVELDSADAEQWGYDKVGNWSTYKRNDNPDQDSDFSDAADLNQSREHNGRNEIEDTTSDSDAIGEDATQAAWDDPAYDDRGNMIFCPKAGNEGTTNLHLLYDAFNRVTDIYEDDGDGSFDDQVDTLIAAYTYDALNRRVRKIVGDTTTVTTLYVYDGSCVIAEYDEDTTDTLLRQYIYGSYIDDPIAMDIPTGQPNVGLYYFIKNSRYDVTALADDTGKIVEVYRYSGFGVMTISDQDDTVITASAYGNSYGFTGRRWDAETGLWYYRNRMYHASIGRFLQRDPAGYVDGVNLYAYVINSPLSFVDPSGTMLRGAANWIAGKAQSSMNWASRATSSSMNLASTTVRSGTDWMADTLSGWGSNDSLFDSSFGGDQGSYSNVARYGLDSYGSGWDIFDTSPDIVGLGDSYPLGNSSDWLLNDLLNPPTLYDQYFGSRSSSLTYYLNKRPFNSILGSRFNPDPLGINFLGSATGITSHNQAVDDLLLGRALWQPRGYRSEWGFQKVFAKTSGPPPMSARQMHRSMVGQQTSIALREMNGDFGAWSQISSHTKAFSYTALKLLGPARLTEGLYGYDYGQNRLLTKSESIMRTISGGIHTGLTATLLGSAYNPGMPNSFSGRLYRPNSTVIGKIDDLGRLGSGENTLIRHMPNRGSPKLNWNQNSSVLRYEMRKGLPIGDTTVNGFGSLTNNTGFLRAERNLFQNHGWEYNPWSQLWSK